MARRIDPELAGLLLELELELVESHRLRLLAAKKKLTFKTVPVAKLRRAIKKRRKTR